MRQRAKADWLYDDLPSENVAEEARPRPHRAERLVDMMDGDTPRRAEVSASRMEADGRALNRLREVNVPPRASVPAMRGAIRASEGARASDYAILSVTPNGEGETVAVVMAVPGTVETDGGGRSVGRVKLHLMVEQYAELISEGISLIPGELTREQADTLLEAGKLCSGIRRGMMLLQYGDCSARRLTYKLTSKGVEREIAETAVAYLSEKGYLREDDAARRRAEQGIRKGWGIRRIRDDLRAHGFSADVTEEALEALNEVDLSARCAAVIRKKYGSIPGDPADRKKMIASLMRQGYGMDEIREAMEMVSQEA